MFIFIGTILLIIIAVALNQKKQPSVLSSVQFNPAFKPSLPALKINPVALEMANKHFSKDWLQFLAAKNIRSAIDNRNVCEMVATAYSQMKSNALEHLLLSFKIHTVDNAPSNIGGKPQPDNYTPLHEAIYELIKADRFNSTSILSALNILSEKAHSQKQREDLELKARIAENKTRLLESKQQLAEQRKAIAQKGNELEQTAAEQKHILQSTRTAAHVGILSVQSEPKMNPSLRQNQVLDLSTGKWEASESTLNDSNREIFQENTEVVQPPLESTTESGNYQLRSNTIDTAQVEVSDEKLNFRISPPVRQNQTFDFSTGKWEVAEKIMDDSIIVVSQESTIIDLPLPELASYSPNNHTNYPEYDPHQYSLGKKYKKKLNLAPQEVKWLNKFWNHSNVFNAIEGCEIEI
ncbi:MAG TPA: hypothetical protein VF679_08410, partial [Pedobacter sp.]